MLKSELRNIIRESKRQLTGDSLDELSLSVIGKLRKHPRFLNARTVLLYHSLPDEVNTRQLIEETTGKNILLPRVTDSENMEIRLYTGPGSMKEGAFHIQEPTGKVFTDYKDIDLAVIPGMAFDMHGHRLGRGKGYYDRFLAQIPDTYKIGVCFSFQLVGHVPTEPTDIAMDEIIS